MSLHMLKVVIDEKLKTVQACETNIYRAPT
jgi:hypothetical protein